MRWCARHPAARQDDETPRIGTLDDLDGETIEMRDGALQLLSGVAAVGEEAGPQPIGIPAAFDEAGRAVTVLDVGGITRRAEQVAGRVGRDWRLRPLTVLPAS